MDNPFQFKPGYNPGYQQNATTRPSPTTSSPHSATHPSPMLANFARSLNSNPGNFEKMMSAIGGYQQQRPDSMHYGNAAGNGAGDGGFAYGGHEVQHNNHAGPSRPSGKSQDSNHAHEQRVTAAGTAAKRGSKACVACKLMHGEDVLHHMSAKS
jgi:hypothetical protein